MARRIFGLELTRSDENFRKPILWYISGVWRNLSALSHESQIL